MSLQTDPKRFALIIVIFVCFCLLLYPYLSATNDSDKLDPLVLLTSDVSSSTKSKHQPSHQKDQNEQKMPHSIPALWIFGPAKTSTTSIYTAIANGFKNWHHPHPNKPFKEYESIWAEFLIYHWFKKKHYHQNLIQFISSIEQNDTIKTLNQYPFKEILSIIPSFAIKKQLNKQYDVFKEIILESNRSKDDIFVIVKTPQHFYSPFIPIIFAYHVSPINYHENQYGTKVMILLRNSIKRTISWYSMFYIKKFIKAYENDEDKVFKLVNYQMNVTLNYEPLNRIRDQIINRKNEYDDILILNEYIKFFYGFSKLHMKCSKVEYDINSESKCQEIDIGLYDNKWDYKLIEYRHINHVRHLIHIIFVGLSYPHLLLPLSVFQQNGLLGNKFRFMSFNYIIKNPKDALYLMTCWSETQSKHQQCNVEDKENDNNIKLPHQKQASVPIPSDITKAFTEYYEPVIVSINKLLTRFSKDNEIFLGEWDPNNW